MEDEEKALLKAQVRDLLKRCDEAMAENRGLRAGISAIHRRAQKSEGATRALASAKRGFEKEIAYQLAKRLADDAAWREECDRLRALVVMTSEPRTGLLASVIDRILKGS